MNDGHSKSRNTNGIVDLGGNPVNPPQDQASNKEIVDKIMSGKLGEVRHENPNPTELEKARIERAKAEQLFQIACQDVSTGISARAVIFNLTCTAQNLELEASQCGDIQEIHKKFYYARSLRVAVEVLQAQLKASESTPGTTVDSQN